MERHLKLLQWLSVTKRSPWSYYLRTWKHVKPLHRFIDQCLPQYIEMVEWKIDEDELESLLFTVGHAAEADWLSIFRESDHKARKTLTFESGKRLRAQKSLRLQEAKRIADEERMLNAVMQQNEQAIKVSDSADDEITAKLKVEIASHFDQGQGFQPRSPQIEAIVRMETMIH